MIKLRYYPIRFEKEGRIFKEVPHVEGSTVSAYLTVVGFKQEDQDLILLGKVVTPDTVLKDGDELIVTPHLGGPLWPVIVAIAQLVWAAVVAHPFIAAAFVISAGYSIYSAISAQQRMPSFGTSSGVVQGGLDESSPTYGWDGIKTTSEVGRPVKLVYGRHRTGGNIINQYISTDGDKQYLNILIAIGEGEIKGVSGIELNENPIENYDGITTSLKLGTNDQTVIANFEDLHNVKAVNANLLQSVAHTITTDDSDVEAFEIHLTLPNGIFQVAENSGAVQSWEVTYQVEYRVNGGGAYTNLGTFAINAKSRNAVRRVFRKEGLTAAKYDVKVTRMSANSSLDPQQVGDLTWESLDQIKTDDLKYPNTALLGIRALATDQLSGGTPNITFIVEGLLVRVPDVKNGAAEVPWEDYYWDPVANLFKLLSTSASLTWNGTTYITRWSGNPIWCIRALQLNTRYGIGNYIETENMNDERLLEMAKFCEERVPDGDGGWEKRFRLDVVIDGPAKAPDVITQLASVFNAFPFYSEGGFSIAIDRPQDYVQVFGMGNIVKGRFSQSWKSKNEVFNVIEVQYINEDQNYKEDVVTVSDEDALGDGDPVKKKEVRVFTTKTSYALRAGRYALKVAQLIHRSLTVTCTIDALACQAGDVVVVSHDVPQWGFSGRVRAGTTTTSVVLGREIELAAVTTYAVLVRMKDDTIEQRTVTSPAGTHSTVTVSPAFSQAPENYDVFAIGEIAQIAKPFRVLGVRRENAGEVALQLIEYDENVYDDTAVVLPTTNYSLLSAAVPAVTNLSLTERVVRTKDGTIENVIDVWFEKPDLLSYQVNRYSKARIYLSDDAGASWQFRGETTGVHFQIIGDLLDGVTYKVAVRSVGSAGDEAPLSTAPKVNIQLVGKSALPASVATFLAIQYRDRLTFGWSIVDEDDVAGYEIRRGDSYDVGEFVVFAPGKGQNEITLNLRVGDDQSYWIKALDTSNNASLDATEAVLSVESIPFTNIIEEYSEQTAWTGTKVNTEVDTGVLILSTGEVTGTYETPERDVGFVAPFKIGIEMVITAISGLAFNSDPDLRFDSSTTTRFSGDEVAGAASFRVRTSEDDITWTPYVAWIPGDYFCRYFQIEMTLTRPDISVGLECSQFNYYADLPDVDEFGESEVQTGDLGTGVNIVYVKVFHQIPAVKISPLGNAARVAVFGQDPDLTDCKVRLYNLSGVEQLGAFSYHIHGV